MKEIPKHFSIIDEGFTIEGTVSGKGRLIIKGTVKGTVTGDNVVIAENGVVHADARANEMTIGGSFYGEVDAERNLVILSTGKCTGEVRCQDLVIEAGGILNASVVCKSS